MVPNGVHEEWFQLDSSPDPGTILCVGRVQRIKGLQVLIRAIAALLSAVKEVRLRIAGPIEDQRYYEELLRLIKSLGVTDRVVFLGPLGRADVLREVSTAEVFALPSLDEGMPLLLLEALVPLPEKVVRHLDRCPKRKVPRLHLGQRLKSGH